MPLKGCRPVTIGYHDDDHPPKKPEASGQLFEKTVALLGVPSFILNTFGPQIVRQARRYPRLFKTLTPIILLLSTIAALTHFAWPLFNSFVGDWLPFTRLKSDDPLYEHLCRWVHYRKHPLPHLDLDVQSASHRRQLSSGQLWWPTDHVGGKDIYYEKSGKRFFWYNRTLFILEGVAWTGHDPWPIKSRNIKLKALSFSHQPIKEVLQQAWASYRQDEALRRTKIFHVMSRHWEPLVQKDIRPLHTVDLDQAVKTSLIDDMSTYLSDTTKTWYRHRGIPYRRGYLFYGAPGTGKTSLSMAIAGHFNFDMFVLSLADPEMSDPLLAKLMTLIDEKSVVLLEDIDSVGLTREIAATVVGKNGPSEHHDDASSEEDSDYVGPVERKQHCNVTLSGILNALDGVASPEGHILIMSTNTPEALDPAMARAGRVDYKVHFEKVSKMTTENIFKRMIGDENGADTERLADEFSQKIPEGRFSPAEIQGYLLNHISDVKATMAGLDAWVEESS